MYHLHTHPDILSIKLEGHTLESKRAGEHHPNSSCITNTPSQDLGIKSASQITDDDNPLQPLTLVSLSAQI